MAKKTAFLGIFLALSFLFSYLESLLIVPIGIPGIKLGLANLVIYCVLDLYGFPIALVLNFARVLLSAFTFSGISSLLYSLFGAMLSLSVMALLKRTGRFSPIGINLAGGICHNIGQLLAAALLFSSWGVFAYLPVLILTGGLSGALIGWLAGILCQRLRTFLQMH